MPPKVFSKAIEPVMESSSSGIVQLPINLIVRSVSALEDLQTEVASSTYDFTSYRKSAENRFDYYVGVASLSDYQNVPQDESR